MALRVSGVGNNQSDCYTDAPAMDNPSVQHVLLTDIQLIFHRLLPSKPDLHPSLSLIALCWFGYMPYHPHLLTHSPLLCVVLCPQVC
jgi:hypothetical protein